MANLNENIDLDSERGGAKNPKPVVKLKEYTKKAYRPLVDVVFKYQDQFTPYIEALTKGLSSGAESLSKDSSNEAEKYVGHLFSEAADGLRAANDKLKTKDLETFSSFISDQAEKKPGVMFSTSYIAGLFLGRLGRHVIKKDSKKTPAFDEFQSPSIDSSLH